MPTPPLSDDLALKAVQAVEAAGGIGARNLWKNASEATGVNRDTLRRRYYGAAAAKFRDDPALQDAARAAGVSDSRTIKTFWAKTKDEDGNGFSVMCRNPNAYGPDDEISLADLVRDAIQDGMGDKRPTFPARKIEPQGDYLLVVDLADIHFGKLCFQTETGYEYNREVARHRVIEGTKALLKLAKPMGIGRILFVLGNDILHVDGPHKKTTSGTPQDVEGSVFQGFSDALSAVKDAIKLCAKVADVDLVHCMSNHDWTMGWALSQTVGAYFENHPNVHSSPYNLSEAHRKYYRYGDNLIGLSHGDGAKEEKLYGAMVTEARQHISQCKNLYWLLHHMHHRMARKRGVSVPMTTAKDHNGMSVVVAGDGRVEGERLNITYVRSPSPPDGWHDRNGFLNRQGVECFIYHPHDGQKASFVEWF